MVIGIFKAESIVKVKNNPFYGDYEVKTEMSTTIVNEKYIGLVPPQNGIIVTVVTCDDNKVTFTIGKYFFTGEPESEVDDMTLFTKSFTYDGHVYEITVDKIGQLVSFDEWYNIGSFENDNEPDSHFSKRSKGISWKLVEM